MAGHRPERVAEMIFREIAERLRNDIKDPRVTPISVTHIEVTRDLSRAVVSFMPLGGGRPANDLADALTEAGRKMRGPIGRALRLRHAPELVFKYDANAEEAFKVMNLLDRLAAERRERGEVAPADDDATGAGSGEGEE